MSYCDSWDGDFSAVATCSDIVALLDLLIGREQIVDPAVAAGPPVAITWPPPGAPIAAAAVAASASASAVPLHGKYVVVDGADIAADIAAGDAPGVAAEIPSPRIGSEEAGSTDSLGGGGERGGGGGRGNGGSNGGGGIDDESIKNGAGKEKERSAPGAVLVTSGTAALAAALAAAERPDAVRGLVLLGPSAVRHDPAAFPFAARLAMRALLARPWGISRWQSHYLSMFYPSHSARRPPDLEEHAAAVARTLSQEHAWRLQALRNAIFLPKRAACEARFKHVKVPAVIVMGDADTAAFPDAAAEAAALAALFSASPAIEVCIAEGSGRLPHAETIDGEPALSAALRLLRRACPDWRQVDLPSEAAGA